MKFKVTFTDTIEADSEEQAWEILLHYLAECVKFEDVVAFDFQKETKCEPS